MIDVVLLYDAGCPNLELARAAVREAVSTAALSVQVREFERGEAPIELRRFASPTVLVEGRDVAVGTACAGTACRVYATADGRFSGAPAVDDIVVMLRSAHGLAGARVGS